MNTDLELDRLIGQQLCSVLTAIDHISLKFVKYPLSETGGFAGSALIDIEEGYSVKNEHGSISVRSSDGLDKFQQGSIELIKLIGATVTEARIFPSEEIGLGFDSGFTVILLKSEMGFDSFGVTYDV